MQQVKRDPKRAPDSAAGAILSRAIGVAVACSIAVQLIGLPPVSAQVVVPQDSPANYGSWAKWCKPDQIAGMNLIINNLGNRIKSLAENSADLEADAEANSLMAEALELLAGALGEGAQASSGCPPVAVGLAIGSAMTSLTAAVAYHARNSDNAQVRANAREIAKLSGYLEGWLELREACCNRAKSESPLDTLQPPLPLKTARLSREEIVEALGRLNQGQRAETYRDAQSGKLKCDPHNRTLVLDSLTPSGDLR